MLLNVVTFRACRFEKFFLQIKKKVRRIKADRKKMPGKYECFTRLIICRKIFGLIF